MRNEGNKCKLPLRVHQAKWFNLNCFDTYLQKNRERVQLCFLLLLRNDVKLYSHFVTLGFVVFKNAFGVVSN